MSFWNVQTPNNGAPYPHASAPLPYPQIGGNPLGMPNPDPAPIAGPMLHHHGTTPIGSNVIGGSHIPAAALSYPMHNTPMFSPSNAPGKLICYSSLSIFSTILHLIVCKSKSIVKVNPISPATNPLYPKPNIMMSFISQSS